MGISVLNGYQKIKQERINYEKNDILIPAPQHTGNAEYTREIAERIASVTGAKVADILKCIP